MSDSRTRRHAGPRRRRDEPEIPAPSYAERARTLVHTGRVGSLSTHSRRQAGYPFGSVMPYAPDALGRPVVLISTMAMHTQNLLGDPKASLLITEEGATGDPLGAGRVTLLGEATKVTDDERGAARAHYLERHPTASYWVDYEDFAFFRLEVVDVYFVGGFGVMGWVAVEDYGKAAPDPLADDAAGIIAHMNEDHSDALVLFARVLADHDAEHAEMTAIDRLGFHLKLRIDGQPRSCRLAFPRPVDSSETCREVMVEMVRNARQAPTG